MVKMYESFWGRKKKKTEEEIENEESDEDIEKGREDMEPDDGGRSDAPKGEGEDADPEKKFKRVMAAAWPKGEGPPLPKVFKLTDVYPGEPPYMRLRTKPTVLRFHKYSATKDAEAYWLSEAMIYMPHSNEDDLVEKINQAKAGEEKWNTFVDEIFHVKSQLMEYLEDTEEARLMAAEMFIDNNLTGEFMNAEGEQEREENQLDEVVQQEEFDHLDPEFLELPVEGVFEKAFRPIEVRRLEDIRPIARRMDENQKKVLEIGIRFARALVKSRGGKNPQPSPAPLVMVDGAAGAGKSTTINLLKEIVQLILQQPGDHPECPYILLCAPTGTAAINIKGQTLHSTFGFTWGDEHYSLPDKTRDTKRATFKYLKFVIIDEVLS
jgi:hypothetical protein